MSAGKTVAMLIFGLSLVFCYGNSSAVPWGPARRRAL